MVKVTLMLWLLVIPVVPYFFTILLIGWYLSRSGKYKPKPFSPVKVSVIAACKNEEKKLPSLLGDLFSQDYPDELYEIIIVDDNSSDNTLKVAMSFNDSGRLKVIKNKGAGKKNAIRTGIEVADGEIIMTTDADCRLEKGWVGSFVSSFNETRAEMIIGPVVLEEGDGFFYRFQELEFLSLQGITAGTAAMINPVMCNGANLAFTSEAYARHYKNLHFEIASGDDIFFLHSIKRENTGTIKFLESPEAIVRTDHSESVGCFLKQRSRWLLKAGYYRDWFTIFLGIVTFVTIIEILFLLVAGFLNSFFLIPLGFVFLIKSVADAFILYETTRRHGKKGLMKWFLPAQVVYPFYVMAVVVTAILRKDQW